MNGPADFMSLKTAMGKHVKMLFFFTAKTVSRNENAAAAKQSHDRSRTLRCIGSGSLHIKKPKKEHKGKLKNRSNTPYRRPVAHSVTAALK